MKNVRTLCISVLLLLSLAWPPAVGGQVYTDVFVGLHPQLLNDGGASAHLNLGIGRQASPNLGYGLNFGTMSIISVSTTSSFTMMGLQYRLLDNNHRFYGKLEFGSLLSANYTTDAPFLYEYDPAFTPYYRLYLGHRFGRFTMGLNFTGITDIRESILAYDDPSGTHLPTGEFRVRNQQDLQIYLGISLDAFRVKRRR